MVREWREKDNKEEEWEMVRNKKIKKSNPTIFVTNLPSNCSSKSLWEHFYHIKNLADAFVPRKKDGRGITFGFLRFRMVEDEDTLVHKVAGIKVDGRKIYANISKYGRDAKLPVFERTPHAGYNNFHNQTHATYNNPNLKHSLHANDKKKWVAENDDGNRRTHSSYADILKGKSLTLTPNHPIFDVEENIKNWDDLKGRAYLGKAKNLKGVNFVRNVIQEQFKDVNIKYIGGGSCPDFL